MNDIRARNANAQQYIEHRPTKASRETHDRSKCLGQTEDDIFKEKVINTHGYAHISHQVSNRVSSSKYRQTNDRVRQPKYKADGLSSVHLYLILTHSHRSPVEC